MTERPFTTRAQRAISLADAQAGALRDDFIGTEHLLLGLLEERSGPAAQMLAQLGVTPDAVRELLRHARSPNTPRGETSAM